MNNLLGYLYTWTLALPGLFGMALTFVAIGAGVLALHIVAKQRGMDAGLAGIPFLNLRLAGELVSANPLTWMILSGCSALAFVGWFFQAYNFVTAIATLVATAVYAVWAWRFTHRYNGGKNLTATLIFVIGIMWHWQIIPFGMLYLAMCEDKSFARH